MKHSNINRQFPATALPVKVEATTPPTTQKSTGGSKVNSPQSETANGPVSTSL